MQEINGITIQRYAELICSTTDTTNENEFWQALEKQGISKEAWQPVKDGWNAELIKPENYLGLMQDYNNALEKAVEIKNNGNPPCSLETFADIYAQISYRKDPDNPEQNMDYERIMKENGITSLKWTEYSGYWAPKTAREDYMQQYYDLLNKYSAKYM
jgi:hypothetical protein